MSPDGKLLALAIQEGGIHVASLEGEPALHAVTKGNTDTEPAFRAGTSDVLFVREEGGVPRILAVPIAGGEPRVLVEGPSSSPAGFPLDSRVLWISGNEGEQVPMVLDRAGRSAPLSRKLPRGHYEQASFSPDGKRVALMTSNNRFIEVEVSTGAVLRTVDTGGEQVFRPTYTGSEMLIIRGLWVGDLWAGDAPLGP